MKVAFRGLLDVNVLVAHAVLEHEHHRQVVRWHRKLPESARLFSCPIVELGLIRNVMRITGMPVSEARSVLKNERENLGLRLIHDTLGAEELPDWILGNRQTTDAYLIQLSAAHGLRLVTLEKHLPGARPIVEPG